MDLLICTRPVEQSVLDIKSIKKKIEASVNKLKGAKSNEEYENQCVVIKFLLNNLDNIHMSLGNLRETQIGKYLTKLESQLPNELATLAKNLNCKWKSVVMAYRQSVKENLATHLKPQHTKEIPEKGATINPELGCMQEPANLSLKKDHQFKNTSFKESFLKPHLENKSEHLTQAQNYFAERIIAVKNKLLSTVDKIDFIEKDIAAVKKEMLDITSQVDNVFQEIEKLLSITQSSIMCTDVHLKVKPNDLEVLSSYTKVNNQKTEKYISSNSHPESFEKNSNQMSIYKLAAWNQKKGNKIDLLDKKDSEVNVLNVSSVNQVVIKSECNENLSDMEIENTNDRNCGEIFSKPNKSVFLNSPNHSISISSSLNSHVNQISNTTVTSISYFKPCNTSIKSSPSVQLIAPLPLSTSHTSSIDEKQNNKWEISKVINVERKSIVNNVFKAPVNPTIMQTVLKSSTADVVLRTVALPEDARNIVLEGDLSIQDVELEPFLSFSQVVDNMDGELEIKDREYLLNNKKKHRDVWNKRCKKTEGMKYATLVKSKGRMKAAHKASLGKHVIHKIVNKNH